MFFPCLSFIEIGGELLRIPEEEQPVIVDDRTLVPVRIISEALGATVNWNETTREVTLSHGGAALTFAIGEAAPGMDVPAQIIGERTFVPLRFISEHFGAIVNWCEDTRGIEILTM